MEDKYIVALEIGSSKIKGAIGTVDASGTLSVKTVEEERLIDSVRYGCILNVLETATAIRTVLNRLEQREPQRKITGGLRGGRRSFAHVAGNRDRTQSVVRNGDNKCIDQRYNG